MSEIQRLQDRVAELEEILGMTSKFPPQLFPGFKFRPKNCEQLLGVFLARPFVSRNAAYEALFGDRPESKQPDPKYIDVMICSLRKALKPHDISIVNRHNQGYYINDLDKARLRTLATANVDKSGRPHERATQTAA